MDIDAAGQDEESTGVVRLDVVANHQSLANGANTTVLDQDIRLIIVNGSHNPPVLDKHCSHLPLPM
jgi:hypothetical protein